MLKMLLLSPEGGSRETFVTDLRKREFCYRVVQHRVLARELQRELFKRKMFLPESCAKEFFLLESLTRESYDFVSMILTCL